MLQSEIFSLLYTLTKCLFFLHKIIHTMCFQKFDFIITIPPKFAVTSLTLKVCYTRKIIESN